MSTPAEFHEPVLDVEVLKRNAQGKPIVVRHYCRVCGRGVSDWKHFG